MIWLIISILGMYNIALTYMIIDLMVMQRKINQALIKNINETKIALFEAAEAQKVQGQIMDILLKRKMS